MGYEHLLSPVTIKNVELRNRMVVPSMGTNLDYRVLASCR